MYGARLPRTKLLSPLPAARFDGRLSVDGRELPVEAGAAWSGTTGAPSTPSAGYGCTESRRRATGSTPRSAASRSARSRPVDRRRVLSLAGERHRLGGPGRRPEVDESPDSCAFQLSGRGLRVRGSVSAPRERFVGWSTTRTAASTTPSTARSRTCGSWSSGRATGAAGLSVPAGATYELGMRERDHGIALQPYPDG